ncbi:hypothetical protein A0256_17055 [Mucilaginibacter sp. PAMC 26640]|nr:hypothetical protein A0256_17055 [Mucilaginibacter sp. PAMC 26640]
MKIKFLMAGLLGLISATTFAQKGELNNAQSEFDKYEAFLKIQPATAFTNLANAKTSIDKAVANEKTSQLAQTFALKGNIYAGLALKDSTAAPTLIPVADEALKKAATLDTKGEQKKLIDNGNSYLAQYYINRGVKEFQAAKYDLAYKSFDGFRTLRPDDTTAILYTGLAAYNSGNFDGAITNYTKLVTTKYSGVERIYDEMSNAYLSKKDTAGALKIVAEGVTKFPSSAQLRKKEIEISLQSGKSQAVLEKVLEAIKNDPKNKSLYFYAGLVYSQTADGASAAAKKTKDIPAKTAANLKKKENYEKAADMFKKAIEVDPNYFEANLNLGYVLLAPAIETYNSANALPGTSAMTKQYNALVAKAGQEFDLAKPYLVKAVELNPKSADALSNLITYYKGKKDDVNVAKYTKLLKEL